MSDTVISRYRPDLHALQESDVLLTRTIENRYSLRSHGTPVITVAQLGKFLFHTTRIKQIIGTEQRWKF